MKRVNEAMLWAFNVLAIGGFIAIMALDAIN